MLYRTGKPIVSFLLSQFFSSIKIRGARPIENGPLLLVSNHPNFMLDPLLVSHSMDRSLFFLAKSTLFVNPFVSGILRLAHLVPIYRPQDSASGEVDNSAVFARVTEQLIKGRGVVIFPEGTSWGTRKIYPFKTGAARIAFQAEAETKFSLNLKIQPLGITYTDFDRYRSDVTLTFGEAISADEFCRDYSEDEREAVRTLTQHIEQVLEQLVVTVEDNAHDELVEKIADLYASTGDLDDDRERLAVVARNVDALAPANPELKSEIEAKLDAYLSVLRDLNLEPGEPLKPRTNILYLLLISPFVLLGSALYYVPYHLIGPLAKRLSKHPVELATYKIFVGAFVYIAWLVLIGIIAFWYSKSSTFVAGALLVAIGLAYFANNYWHQVQVFILSKLWPGSKTPISMLVEARDKLIRELDSLRVS